MADDTTLPHPAPATSSILGGLGAKPAEKAPDTAAAKLRAFEDKHLGKDATRINGEVERGVGSRFKAMTPEQHAEYAALEALVKAETDIADSSAKLDKAKQDHEAALKKLADAQKASETTKAA